MVTAKFPMSAPLPARNPTGRAESSADKDRKFEPFFLVPIGTAWRPLEWAQRFDRKR